jgi:uncharacterized protein (DUF2147 family)
MREMIYKALLFVFGLMAVTIMSFSAEPEADELLGIWLNHEKDAHVKIYKCDEQYCGKIVWLKEPEENGETKKDKNNPDDSLKMRPLKGLDILSGFSYDSDGKWDDGTIYNPRDGKTYSCYLKILEDGRLKVRGFVGISLIGKTNYWTRIE